MAVIINQNRIWREKKDDTYYLYLRMGKDDDKCIAMLTKTEKGIWYMYVQKDYSLIDTEYYFFPKPTEQTAFVRCESDDLAHCKEEVEGRVEMAFKRFWRTGIKVLHLWRAIDYAETNGDGEDVG